MQLLPLGKQQFFDNSGAPLANGQVYFYAPGTTTFLDTWPVQSGGAPNPNPVVLDSTGAAAIWGDTTYRQVVKDSAGTVVWDEIVDASVSSAALAAPNGSYLVGFVQGGSDVARSSEDKQRETVTPMDFAGTGTGCDDTEAIQRAINYLYSNFGGGEVWFPRGYKCTISSVDILAGVVLRSTEVFRGGGATITANTAGATMFTHAAGRTNGGLIGFNISGKLAGGGYASKLITMLGGGFLCRNVSGSDFSDQVFTVGGIVNCVENIGGYNGLLTRARDAISGVVEFIGTDCYAWHIEATTGQNGIEHTITDANLRCGAINIGGNNNSVFGAIGELSDVGMYITGSDARIIGNRADLNYGHGFIVSGSNNQIIGNYSLNNGQATDDTYDAFVVSGIGNVFSGNRANTKSTIKNRHRYGFNDSIGSNTVDQHNSYDPSNRSVGQARLPFLNNGFLGSGFSKSNQLIRNAVNSSTIDATSTSLVSLASYSAATDITSISGNNGDTVRIHGNSLCTIINGPTLQTNTGANKVMASKIYAFTNINGIWYEQAS